MFDILHQVPFSASAEELYAAITTQEGLKAWWTTSVEAEPKEGSTAVFSFEGGQVVFRMRVERLEEGRYVEWSVLDPAPPEWENTRVTWEISETEDGSSLLFGHRGWASTEGSYPAINYNWAYYLMSLNEYLDEGGGFPHQNEA